MPRSLAIMLRCVLVSVFRRRSFFLVLCFMSVLMFVILQSNIQTDHEKLRSSIYSGNITNLEGRTFIKDESVAQLISRGHSNRHRSLILVDDRKKAEIPESKYSNGGQLSFLDKHPKLLDGEDFKDDIREDKNGNSHVDSHVDKNDDEQEGHDMNVYKAEYETYNADRKDNQEFMDLLYKLLWKLNNEDNTLEKQGKLDDIQDDNWLPFHPLQYPQRINVENIVKTFAETGDLPSNSIYKWKYKPIINPSSKCKYSKYGIFVLFIVKTKPNNFVKRKTIRETWADEKRFPNIRTVFSIGIPQDSSTIRRLKLESLKYKDILLMDYLDSYNNLTLKTTSGINWAVAHCSVAGFVVSVDDDMYVATDFLIQHLKDMPQAEAERLYHGHLYHNTKPIRHGKKGQWHSKWIITKEEYAFDTYPDYIFGGFVIMSMQTVVEISLAIPFTRPINMEDVYLGIVASRLGIVATNTDLVDVYITYSNVEKFKTLIASHYYTSSHMLKKAWECHLSMVESDVKKSVFCLYLKTELEQLKNKIDGILDWIDTSDNAL